MLRVKKKEVPGLIAPVSSPSGSSMDKPEGQKRTRRLDEPNPDDYNDPLEFLADKKIEEEDLTELQTEGESTQKVKGLPDPILPTKEIQDEHNLTHAQFQSWCRHCVRGRSMDFPHNYEKEK